MMLLLLLLNLWPIKFYLSHGAVGTLFPPFFGMVVIYKLIFHFACSFAISTHKFNIWVSSYLTLMHVANMNYFHCIPEMHAEYDTIWLHRMRTIRELSRVRARCICYPCGF